MNQNVKFSVEVEISHSGNVVKAVRTRGDGSRPPHRKRISLSPGPAIDVYLVYLVVGSKLGFAVVVEIGGNADDSDRSLIYSLDAKVQKQATRFQIEYFVVGIYFRIPVAVEVGERSTRENGRVGIVYRSAGLPSLRSGLGVGVQIPVGGFYHYQPLGAARANLSQTYVVLVSDNKGRSAERPFGRGLGVVNQHAGSLVHPTSQCGVEWSHYFGIAVAVEVAHHGSTYGQKRFGGYGHSVVYAERKRSLYRCAIVTADIPRRQSNIQTHVFSLLTTLRLSAGDIVVRRRHRVTQCCRSLARGEGE